MAGIVSYYCEKCKKSRKMVVLPDVHNINLTESPNGLVAYSDIHQCVDDILGVSNIFADSHYNIRGVEYMKLPKAAVLLEDDIKPAIPIPSASKSGTILSITDILPDAMIRMIYHNEEFNYQIKIGTLSKMNKPVKTQTSQSAKSKLEYFESEINYSDSLEKWINLFLETMEKSPPVRLGIAIEAIIYILENHDREIESIDEKLIDELFHSHLINISLNSSNMTEAMEKITKKFNDDTVGKMKVIIAELDMNPNPQLYEMAGLAKDLTQLILNLYVLEKLQLIEFNRDEQHDHTSDLAIRKSIAK